MFSEQRIRAILFYGSVAVFLAFLPMVLSSALGYKFDRRKLKFTRTGLIFIKTQPAGAAVYLNEKLLNDRTPVTINELMPGEYRIRVELETYYPWVDEVQVEAGKATAMDKIILFPLRTNIKQINRERFKAFWIDDERQAIYYVNLQDNCLYRSDLSGERYQKLAGLVALSPPPLKYRLSLNREKVLYFNSRQLAITDISPNYRNDHDWSFVLDSLKTDSDILDAFWHSDGYHIIMVRKDRIDVIEARAGAEAVVLAELNKDNTSAFYDIRSDTLYFLDSQQAGDSNTYDNLYKIELNQSNFPWQDLIKRRHNEGRI